MYDASRVFLDTLGANRFADARPVAMENDASVAGMNFIVANQNGLEGLGWRVAPRSISGSSFSAAPKSLSLFVDPDPVLGDGFFLAARCCYRTVPY